MAIKIYTYANPYEIDREIFWDEIKYCPQFCVSQTMVNGMMASYPIFREHHHLVTVQLLVNALYADWASLNTRIRQMMEVDAILQTIPSEQEEQSLTVKRALAYNVSSFVDCIRIFQELGLQKMPLLTMNLNDDQRYLVELYQCILQREKSSFVYSPICFEETINAGVIMALQKKYPDIDISQLDMGTIIFHGIHQFSPAMLRAIEDISKYKTVILLFNYQEQYSAIYQTWLNIYSLFDLEIRINGDNQFHPMPLMVDSYRSNLLADQIGKLADGVYTEFKGQVPPEVIEFSNITEFSGYVARIFERAQKAQKNSRDSEPVLTFMPEQFYSASGRVNDILRAYFPEQFGERHFLDYPLGHFFVSTLNMWDPEKQCVKVEHLSDIKECLGCGIISESRQGQHLNSFNQITPFIEKESTLEGALQKLRKLKKYVGRGTEESHKVGYLAISKEDLNALIKALEELQQIVQYFFIDFQNGADNFRRFYQRVQKFIIQRVSNLDDLDNEMREVIQRLLLRLQSSDLPETGTFICLQQTMGYYLSQDENLAKGAHWIVRDFEQIDGDILRSSKQDADKVCYHFCCLSDKDICAAKDERLPWPLDIHFFETACEPLDWKYQIFLKSKMEFRNFKKYALLYGLQFNRVGCKLSYVKTENKSDNDVFHFLTLLGAKIRPYREFRNDTPPINLSFSPSQTIEDLTLEDIDLLRWAQCPYRFVLESLVQGRTVYRDRFLIHNYMRVLLIHRVCKDNQGKPYSDDILRQSLEEAYQQIADKFHILNELEKTQLLYMAYQELQKNGRNSTFAYLQQKELDKMRLREVFLRKELSQNVRNVSDKEILRSQIAGASNYTYTPGNYCVMCASKDICLKKIKEH